MIELFEKDALMLKKYTKGWLSLFYILYLKNKRWSNFLYKAISSSCIKVANAQSTTISATQELSYYLRLYGDQKFPLDSSNSTKKNELNSVAANLNKFAYFIDEISTCLQVFSTQLNDSVIYQLNKIIDDEFDSNLLSILNI